MNREQLVRNIKREMKRWIDQMDEQNYIETKETLDKYYQLMDSVTSLPAPPPVIRKKKKAPVEDAPTVVVEEDISDVNIEEDSMVTNNQRGYDEDKRKEYEGKAEHFFSDSGEIGDLTKPSEQVTETVVGYKFERKLRGGVLPEISAFIPEGVIRKLGLQHGDLVEARKISEVNGKSRYNYTLAESRGKQDDTGRMQFDYCIVEKEAGCLVVKRNCLTEEPIKCNGVPFPSVLSEIDIQYFSIKEGDIIDIAFREKYPMENRVVWRHESEFPAIDETKKDRKQKEVDTSKEMSDELEQTLAGREVLIIGNEANKSDYKVQIEKRGGRFLWADASKRTDSYPSLVKKSSFTIFLLGLSGHTGMKQIKQLCKDYNKPFEATFNQGVTSIIRTAEELALTKKNEQKKESI